MSQQLAAGEWLPDHHERAVCAEPIACVVCVLSPLDGESHADWLVRLRGEVQRQSRDEAECIHGHPWSDDTTRYTRDGWRYCLLCSRQASRLSKARQRVAS